MEVEYHRKCNSLAISLLVIRFSMHIRSAYYCGCRTLRVCTYLLHNVLQENSLLPAEPVGVPITLSQLEIALCNKSWSFHTLMNHNKKPQTYTKQILAIINIAYFSLITKKKKSTIANSHINRVSKKPLIWHQSRALFCIH